MKQIGTVAAAALWLLVAAALVTPTAGSIHAEEAKPAAQEKENEKEKESKPPPEKGEAKLSATIAGVAVPYTVKTGLTPILDENGEEKAHIFSTSYLMDDGERERPVIFLFNGGPGSASVYLHSGSFAPMIIHGVDGGLQMPRPPYKFAPNPHSLLDVADLVFIDPVGTGLSRAATPEKKDGKDGGRTGDKQDGESYWGVKTDIESMVEFIRMWLFDNDRWGAEIYLAGESYGGLRAAGMAGALEAIGVAPSGVVLISPAVSYFDVEEGLENVSPYVNVFPTLAAVAHYHGRLGEELQRLPREELVENARKWSEEKLFPALRAGNRLAGDEREALIREMSEMTSIPEAEIRARRLRLDIVAFSNHLLRDRERFLGLYDGRLTAPGYSWSMDEDPTMALAGEPYKTGLMRFFTETVGIKPKRPYVYSSMTAFRAWDFTLGFKGRLGFVSTSEELARAMRRLPFMRVYLAMGRYDLVTPPESALQSLSRIDAPEETVRKNIRSRIYEGGHMMYCNPEALEALSRDLREWIREK